MAHHWSEMDPAAAARLSDLVGEQNRTRDALVKQFMNQTAVPGETETLREFDRLGATGNFPDGKVTPGDEGEIRFNVVADDKQHLVFVDFGKPVHLLGMTPEQAVDLAGLLIERARYARM